MQYKATPGGAPQTITVTMTEFAFALDRVAFEEAWQAGARLTLDDLEAAPARA